MGAADHQRKGVPLRRDEALAYIVDRIARTGNSPTFDEIGIALGVGPTRAKQLVGQLVARGVIERTPGAQRSFRVCDVDSARNALEQVMRRLGWAVAEPMGELQRPCPQGQLPILPPFEHLPDID